MTDKDQSNAGATAELGPLKFDHKHAKAWWALKMPNSRFRAARLKGDGYVSIEWADNEESGTYSVPWVLMSRDLGAQTATTTLAQREGDWQPIETAPKDGTRIDVWINGEFPGRRSDVEWREPTDSEWWVHGGDTIASPDATWHDCFGPLGKSEQPTHWKPLPSPPSSLSEQGEGR